MSDVQTAINAIRIAIATAEALLDAMDKAKSALAENTDQLKEQLKALVTQSEKESSAMHDQLAKDRKEERDAFDKKFEHAVADDVTKP